MTTLLIDNFDSFTWNVYQSLCNLGANVLVYRNNEITLQEAINLEPRSLVISPGPGYPSTAGISSTLIKYFQGKIPILGVCLGEQAIFELYGGKVVPCGELVHGKTTPVKHDGKYLFAGVDQDIECTRYHSLAGSRETLPSVLEVTAWTDSGIIMGVRHKSLVVTGVQFHPESIASEQGDKMFRNFLTWEGGTWDSLIIHPEWIVDYITPGDQNQQDMSSGIPLELASKMNSTVAPIWTDSSPPKSESILQKIFQKRKQDVFEDQQKIGSSFEYLERCYAMGLAPTVISFRDRLLQSVNQYGVAVLAEIKRASPSKGDIDVFAQAPEQALVYSDGGAAAISVLTEPNWFKGSIEDLRRVRAALDKIENRPAVLCKEFIFDRYQILEARLAGADTILLIVAILSDKELKNLISYSRDLGMEPLVEVASEEEMKRAVSIGAGIIGVNNRDLNTFTVDSNRTNRLSGLANEAERDIILLALSGITSRADVSKYIASGARGVLVGEALMRAPSKSVMIRELLGAPSISPSKDSSETLVKICGLTNAADALFAAENGADLLGFIFAESSPRKMTREKVRVISNKLSEIYGIASNHELPPTIMKPTSTAEWFRLQKLPKKRPLLVGVFTNQTAPEINEITEYCNLDLIQLHIERDPSFHRLLNRPIVQVIGISDRTYSINDLLSKCQIYTGTCNALLLDTKTAQQEGGTGKKFDWNIARKLINEGVPIWLAGGLSIDNVDDAINLKARVLDVSSSLESTPGKKETSKVLAFIKAAHKTR